MKEQCICIIFALLACSTMLSFAKAQDQGPPAANEGRNHLGETTSPYLLQHQYNPVHWYPWGDEAFEAARDQNKLIFLNFA